MPVILKAVLLWKGILGIDNHKIEESVNPEKCWRWSICLAVLNIQPRVASFHKNKQVHCPSRWYQRCSHGYPLKYQCEFFPRVFRTLQIHLMRVHFACLPSLPLSLLPFSPSLPLSLLPFSPSLPLSLTFSLSCFLLSSLSLPFLLLNFYIF